jgi:hypothetical protein
MDLFSRDGLSVLSRANTRASKIMAAFPDILITRTHSYEVNHKYQFVCSNQLCGVTFGRQRKMDLTRKVCGRCKSTFVQTKPVPRESGENKTNAFGLFVKERFAEVRKSNPGSPHKEIMGILSKKYREEKNGDVRKNAVTAKREVEIIEIESEDEVEEVINLLDVLQV